jgi:serine/threonine protein kinase
MKDLQRIRSVFCEALERQTPEEREAYLSQVCGEDAALRAEVEMLLRAQPEADGFFQAMPIGGGDIPPSQPPEAPGTVIGRYKLLEKIGEGGMAVVYMAEQTEPIRRKVALKIIKLGMDTRQVIARFEAERQALALMDHPSIAKVLDAGATETGRPYFVMELVQGVSITEYCDKDNLSTKDRLALFLQVCSAVQHAHQKGIIHRDIKPSNVMVTHHGGKPVPKVIDFGIAKATNQRLTEKTLFTRYAHIIGTPAYMSPEQAELSDLDIDTRTDIYSLGVLLYELLTGTTPFTEEELRKAGYIEMQRIIREQEPAKPSTRLTTLGETLTDIAKRRACTPDLLRKAVRGDLDWIVMKSLEKDRLRRYETPEALALDIQRHLEHRPVLAHAPSAGYRLHKFLRRHRAQAIAALSMSLLGGTLIVVFSLWTHSRSRFAEAEGLRHRAILSQAQKHSAMDDPAAALETLEPILDSRYVGVEARLLRDRIQQDVRERLSYYAREIEAHPQDANPYFERARYYSDYLHDRQNANADMRQWALIVSEGSCPVFRFATERDFRRVINLPFDRQIVFSAERPVSEIPVLCVAFGQKGRGSMKSFEIPMVVTSLFGLCLLAGLDAPPAYADFAFGAPTNVGPPVNSSADDGNFCVSADGLELYFASTRQSVYPDFDLYIMTRASVTAEWSGPANLGPTINSTAYDATPCISPDGLELFFGSDRPGGSGKPDLWVIKRSARDAPWGTPVNLGPTVNSAQWEQAPTISSDGLTLYFESNRQGQADIWFITRASTHDAWTSPKPLGAPVNSTYNEWGPCLSRDGLVLFFTSDNRPGGMGDYDIWVTTRVTVDSPWSSPVNLGPGINSPAKELVPTLSPDDSVLYFASGRPGGYGGYDIYQAPIIPVVDFDDDGKVDGKEVLAMAEHWGGNDPLCDIGPMPWGDGVVDANDLIVLADYIGTEWIDPTLLAYWAMDEGAGSVAIDWVGRHDAMVAGNAVWQLEGRIGGALAFDGKTNFARTMSPVLDPAQGPLSVVAWVKGGATGRAIVSQVGAADWLYLNQYGMLTTDLKSAGQGGKSLTSDAFVLDDQWHRVALVWDGTNRSLHMDEVEVARDTQPNLAPSSGLLQIGCGKNAAPAAFWSGVIDDVRIYNRAVQP